MAGQAGVTVDPRLSPGSTLEPIRPPPLGARRRGAKGTSSSRDRLRRYAQNLTEQAMRRAHWLGILVCGLTVAAGADEVCGDPQTKGVCEAVTSGEMRMVSEEELDDGRYRVGSLSRKVYKRTETREREMTQLRLEAESRWVPGTPDALACEIDGSLSYYQRGDAVEVNAVIDNEDCAASDGRYRIRVIARDEQGERISDSYNESWSRVDGAPVTVTHHYPIVPNGLLVRASLRPIAGSCRCSALDAVLE